MLQPTVLLDNLHTLAYDIKYNRHFLMFYGGFMNISYLREFTTLAETKNYWEAAEQLYMNQSTLSKHIKIMEAELDVQLFDRSTRRVELTKYGIALLPYAQSIIHQESEYSSLLLQMKNQENGLLVIGSIPVMAQYGIVDQLSVFQKSHPESNINIIEEDPQNLVSLLRSKKCELIFLRESKLDFVHNFMEDSELVRIPFVRDHLVALLPEQHPLSQKKGLTLPELRNENFCMIKEGTFMHDLCMKACHGAGFTPKIAFTSHRIDSIIEMVAAGDRIALLMDRHVHYLKNTHILTSRCVTVDIAPKIYTQISLCYLSEASLSGSALAFVDFIQKMVFSGENI